jgi:HK97 family phage major capsid protein
LKHVSTRALIAGAIEIKGDDEDPVSVVTKSLEDLTKAVGGRLDALEKKGEAKPDLSPLERRLADLEKKANRPNVGDPTDGEQKEQVAAEKKAFATYLRLGNNAPADELKTLIVSADPQGGYLAPNEMATEMIRDITEVSPIRGLASVRTTTAPAVTYPKRTSITNAVWRGETQEQTGSEPGFGQLEIPVREVSTYVDISNQLLQDSASAEAEVRLALAEDFAQKEGAAFVKGTGTLDPTGILTDTSVTYVASDNASTLGTAPADTLIGLFYAVKPTYRNRGAWLMNGSTLAAIRKLKDSTTNIYLWQPSLAAGQPETILGRPVVEDPEMPDIGAGNEPIVFGDIATAYRIIDRVGLSILVNPYLLATNGVTRIHATRRVGGAVVQPVAIKKLRVAAS